MNKIVITDTCFWIGLVDPYDPNHEASLSIAELLENNQIIFPWPCLYETISTRMTRRRERMMHLEGIISRPNVVLFNDNDYMKEAMKQVFELNRIVGSTYSLTDSVIREILKDINIKINYLVTYNVKDFQDVCSQRKIEIIDN